MKLKLFFDATPLIEKHVSGVGKVLQESLIALDTEYYALKYDMFIFVPFNEAAKAKTLQYKYIKLKLLPYPHKIFSLFTRMKWSPPIDLFLGKGVYVFENFRNISLLRSKSITYVHDVAFKIYPEFIQELNLNYLNKYIDLWISRTDQLVAVSESSKKDLLEVMGINNVRVVSNATNTSMFYPRAIQEVDALRAKWDIPKNYFIFIGNIEPRKNLTNTITAFVEYVKENKANDALVIIGGGGWKNEDILAAIENAKAEGVLIIRPNGYVPDEDLPGLITGARSLIQFSWHEGFGLPLLQALACGVPVAATNIYSLREAAGNNLEQVSFADNPADIKELSSVILQASRKSHIAKPSNILTWDETIKSLEQIIDSL